jgi:hypothetical protein
MQKILFIVLLLIVQASYAKAQLWLSPVNTGDCVAPRIRTKKTSFVRELDKKYCAQNLPDKTKERTCLKNTRLNQDFSFFTDRCSESDYFIGIKGDEIKLRRISKKPGKPNPFIGTFAGSGFSVVISLTHPIKKTPFPDEPRDEDEVEGGAYDVLITVKKGARKKIFNGILMYGL